MELRAAVVARRSIRAYRPDPVPRRILQEIMEEAFWAPSWGNTQPWGFTIVGGETLERIRAAFLELHMRGVEPRPELAMPSTFSERQTARYRGLGRALFQSLGIERQDREGRGAWYGRMAGLFGAPNVIYLHLEKGFNSYALLDAGLVLQTIALLAVDRGLGTCFLAWSVRYPEVLREHARIPADRILVMGLAIGVPDFDHPANGFQRERGELQEFLQWVDVS